MHETDFETVAEAYLALLRMRGIDWLLANAGTDFAPLIEALVRLSSAGVKTPRVVAIPHEAVAVGMAHGYYLVTGRPQAVMVHVNVGVANSLVGLMNAARANVPILFTSGRTPYTESGHTGSRDLPIHWGQEMRDQAGLAREHVKWEHELTYGDQIETVIDRALSVAMAEPRGPVYLSLPRETLAAGWDGGQLSEVSRQSTPTALFPEPAAIDRSADLLARAQRPLIVSAQRTPGRLEGLGRLAERFAMPVVEYWSACQSLSSEHPMHAGFEVSGWIEEVDAVLVLEAQVPWIPQRHSLADDCAVVQVGVDPLFTTLGVRGHGARVSLCSEVGPALEALEAALEPRLATESGRLDERRERIIRRIADSRESVLRMAEKDSSSTLRRDGVSRALDGALGGEALVFNELGCLPAVMSFPDSGSYFGISIAGGLGWGLPAALGAQLADRDQLVVATVGDGSYIFANPVACHHVAQSLELPVLTVVFNNQGWEAVRKATVGIYPEGEAVAASEMPLTVLAPSPAFAAIVEASGGHGELVESQDQLQPALDRALRVVREERRQALVDVRIEMG